MSTSVELFHEDYCAGVSRIADGSIDLVIADPPYGLGKDYGNGSDKKNPEALVNWTLQWVDLTIPKIKPSGSLYIFTTWRNAPEIFSQMKKRLLMVNEIVWDRCVPSMGGSTRRFSSVHDTIGYFAVGKQYYFNVDAVRIPYDAATKKARSRRIFEGAKWLEIGYNPKDVWKVSRLHRQHQEREEHPTQKPLEIIKRMVLASCPKGGVVLDPFAGSGTTLDACQATGRACVGYEINAQYCEVIRQRLLNKRELFAPGPSDTATMCRKGTDMANVGTRKKRRPNLNFYEVGIPNGSTLIFRQTGEKATVIGERRVRFQGVAMSLTMATRKILGYSDTHPIQPAPRWLFAGRSLRDIYNETHGTR